MPGILKSVQPRLIYRFIALFMVMALVVAATGSFGIWKMSQLGSHLEGVLKKRAALEKMAALMKVTAHECQFSLLVAVVISTDKGEFERNSVEYRLKQEWFRRYFDVLLKGDPRVEVETAQQGGHLRQKLKIVEENWAVFESVAERLLARKEILLKANSPATINKGVRNAFKDDKPGVLAEIEIETASFEVDKAIDEVLVTISGMMIETRGEVKTIQQRAMITFIAVIILAVMLAVMLGMRATRRIIIPLNELDHAAHRLAMGDLSSRVRIKAGGEIQKLFDSFNQMAENLEKRTNDLHDAQKQLLQEEKLAMLGRIAGNMGNELRNPLGVMNNAVFFLRTVMPDANETVREYLEIIGKEIDNSGSIISDLLDYCQGRAPRTEPVAVHELIRQSRERCTIPENIEFQADLPETLPQVQVDPLQMEQVFQNLIANAVQAMPDGGVLRIAARRVLSSEFRVLSSNLKAETLDPKPDADVALTSEFKFFGSNSELKTQNSELDGDFIEISVTDSGEGIAAENMEKLFQPLFTTKSRGIGLGLAISQQLTEANGGRIGVISEVDKGSTFTVILPAGMVGP